MAVGEIPRELIGVSGQPGEVQYLAAAGGLFRRVRPTAEQHLAQALLAV